MQTDVAANIRTKSIYETPTPSDGYRVLATRYWPRGISKDSIDAYIAGLAPSRELLHQYRQGQLDWRVYRNQYLAEMRGETARREIHRLARLAREQTVTVMCVCKDADRCHRSLLRDLIISFDQD
jgi:uncharacterized protein YeaO (DUF488 family)